MTATVGDATVLDALSTVIDPELDEPITELGFVTEASVHNGHATVRLRLPTYFCAPNFAYLMVADGYDAVRSLPGVTSADVRLADHFAAEEINAGVAEQGGFVGAFPGEAIGELAELRLTFQRKAYLACLDRLGSRLVAEGRTPERIAGMTVGDVGDCPELTSLLRRRTAIGLGTAPGDPLLLDEHGTHIRPGEAALRLRFARAVRVSIEGNSGWCRGLLKTRYPETG
ncbi:metal-sulfur cluster biosynthetic enzyme [Amycolatopsis antarctica]|uniref:Metal-sulfur cluster biosynthetic enzyme n=1 Tax=Amycolatopsis antarctica TaxID=1854586 RepID=A0A263D1J8_9PSEU|nr:iron-sulfur cluster assembly protein [Amycolatopsis antarctica]OZM71386.1 metal-sulfur cluster biosynthetic enzyme [Amycolatopsis antarctica]